MTKKQVTTAKTQKTTTPTPTKTTTTLSTTAQSATINKNTVTTSPPTQTSIKSTTPTTIKAVKVTTTKNQVNLTPITNTTSPVNQQQPIRILQGRLGQNVPKNSKRGSKRNTKSSQQQKQQQNNTNNHTISKSEQFRGIGMAKIKTQRRDLLRRITYFQKKGLLDPQKEAELQHQLSQLDQQYQEMTETNNKVKKLSTTGRKKTKQFDLGKIRHVISNCRKKLSLMIGGLVVSPEEALLRNTLADAIEKKMYIIHYPPTEVYIGLNHKDLTPIQIDQREKIIKMILQKVNYTRPTFRMSTTWKLSNEQLSSRSVNTGDDVMDDIYNDDDNNEDINEKDDLSDNDDDHNMDDLSDNDNDNDDDDDDDDNYDPFANFGSLENMGIIDPNSLWGADEVGSDLEDDTFQKKNKNNTKIPQKNEINQSKNNNKTQSQQKQQPQHTQNENNNKKSTQQQKKQTHQLPQNNLQPKEQSQKKSHVTNKRFAVSR